MDRKVRRKMNNSGQVALEYFLLSFIVLFAASLTWVFYQGFVSGNLYGKQGMGLEKVVSRPYP